jgi:hypothetical protein
MIVNANSAIKKHWNKPDFFNSSPIFPNNFSSKHCHYTSYLTRHIIPHISAPVLLIFHPFLKTKRDSTRCELSKCSGGDVRIHIIGIEQEQTAPDPFRHVKNSRSATATERNWDVMETFLSVWTSPFNYTRENFTERWRSLTERTCDIVWIGPSSYAYNGIHSK